MRLAPLFILLLIAGCSSDSLENKIVGKWKIDSSNYFAPNEKYKGLGRDYYNLDNGRIIEYRKDFQSQWNTGKHSFSYKINSKDSLIVNPNKSIKIIKLNNSELVIRETLDSICFLTTYFSKIKD